MSSDIKDHTKVKLIELIEENEMLKSEAEDLVNELSQYKINGVLLCPGCGKELEYFNVKLQSYKCMECGTWHKP